MSKVMKIGPVGARFLAVGQTDRQRDVTKLFAILQTHLKRKGREREERRT
jgi:hypothetical protein